MVTATRREERLQDVPIPVTALSPKKLEDQGILSVQDITRVTPGLIYTTTGPNAMPTIRGVGTRSFSPGDSPPVALYVDNVYLPAEGAGMFEFGDIERIEVLKGPQGTLFGRNATGGAINVVTKTPSGTPSLDADIGVASYGRVLGSMYVTGPLAPNLDANFTAFFDRDTGFMTNLVNGEHVPDMDDIGVRSKLLYTPNSMVSIQLEGDYSSTNSPESYMNVLYSGTNRNTVAHPADLTTGVFGLGYSSVKPIALDVQYGATLTGKFDFGSWNLRSITAERETVTTGQLDTDGTSAPLTYQYLKTLNQTFTQEFIAASDNRQRLSWVGGLFFMDDDASRNPNYSYTSTGTFSTTFADERTIAAAPYGEATFKVTPQFSLILGGRYSYEYKKLVNSTAVNINCLVKSCTTPMVDASHSWTKFNYRVTAQYKVDESLNFYATNSTGFKSGTYNSTAFSSTPVDPENLTAYEIGMKSTRFGVTFDADAFYYDDRGIQISRSVNPLTGVSALQNAAEATDYGIEATLSARLNPNWSGDIGVTALHSRYKSFPNADVLLPRTVAAGGGNVETSEDVSGFPVYRAPDLTLNADINYTHELFDGRFNANAGVYYSSKYSFEPSNHVVEPAYATLHLQAAWTTGDGKYTVTAWGDNVTNAHYYTIGSSTILYYSGVWAMPATYGLKFSLHL